jgi:hypothetical protein
MFIKIGDVFLQFEVHEPRLLLLQEIHYT